MLKFYRVRPPHTVFFPVGAGFLAPIPPGTVFSIHPAELADGCLEMIIRGLIMSGRLAVEDAADDEDFPLVH